MKKMRKTINFIIALSISASLLTAPTVGAEPLNIKTPQNAAAVIDAEANDTIAVLKEKIETLTGIDKNRQRLFFNSAELEETKTVSEYGILNGKTPIYIRLSNTVTATVSDAQINGNTGKQIESSPTITVKLYGGTFNSDALSAVQNFNEWFKNLPTGINAVKKENTADEIKFEFSGTPSLISGENLKITIPKEYITDAVEDNDVIENLNAKWNIIKGISKINITANIADDGTVDRTSLLAKDEVDKTIENSTLTYKIEYEGVGGTNYAKSEEKPTAAGKYKIYITASNADYAGNAEYNFNIKSEVVSRNSTLDLTLGEVSYKDEFAIEKTFNPSSENAVSSEGWSWNYETKTLTLNGVVISAGNVGVELPNGANIYLKSKNKITAGTDGAVSYAVHSSGTIGIDGDADAQLEAEVSKGTEAYAINADELNISGAKIKATAGASDSTSCGIYANRITIADSVVTAESTKIGSGSVGINGGTIVIGEGAEVQAKGPEKAFKTSGGIVAVSHSVTNADKFEAIADGGTVNANSFESGKTCSITNKENEYVTIRNGRRIIINTGIDNGSISIVGNKNYAQPGEKVIVSTVADPGYEASFITATDKNGKPISVINCAFIMPDSDVTVNAIFNETGSRSHTSYTYVTVKFNTNGGSEISDLKLRTNQRFVKVDESTKPGYVFTGWYLDAACKREFNTDSAVSSSMTLYAGWKTDPQNRIVLKIGQRNATMWGKEVTNDVAPVIRNERTMLPARFVAEALGAQVSWSDAKREVTIRGFDKNGETVVMYIYIDSDQAFVNGKAVKLDSPAFIENDRTYTPIRFISEKLGAEVDWNEASQTVTITKD